MNAAGATVPATAGRAVGIMKEGEDSDSDEEEAVPGAGSDGKVYVLLCARVCAGVWEGGRIDSLHLTYCGRVVYLCFAPVASCKLMELLAVPASGLVRFWTR